MITGTTTRGIAFVRTGEDATLVILNGGQGFVRKPDPGRLLRDAARTARLLPPGRPFVLLGYDPQPAPDLSIDMIVAATIDAIEQLPNGGGPVDLAGISYGGMVACRVAAARPDLVRRLLLVASAHRFSAEGAARVNRQIALLEAGDIAGFTRAFAGLSRRPWLNALIALSLRLARRRIARGMAPLPVILAYLHAMRSAPPADLAALTAPTLIIGGTADQFYGDGAMPETAAMIATSDLRLIPNETHMAPVEVARAFRAWIAGFLG